MANDNLILPFQLESSRLRGRIVRLGSALDGILSAHKAYPEDVLYLTGETLILGALLSSMLKYEGIFTLQTSGEGPVTMLVADMTSKGDIRACAAFRAEDLQQRRYIDNRAELLGKGYMAFTVDQGEFAERYQGIVELKNESLLTSVQHYFNQSEQIQTGMMMALGRVDGRWRGCGIMLQQMPEDAEHYNKDVSNLNEDDWRRAMVLLSSAKEDEMLAPDLSPQDLLFRLFHEEGVRVFEPLHLAKNCRCSAERVRAILEGMPPEDIDEVTVEGKIVMTCEFCSTEYVFNPEEFKQGKTI